VNSLAEAYGQGAAAWADGPTRVYGPLAELLVAFSPQPLAGTRLLDLGSGTGVGSRAASAAGARVVAVDLAPEMLLVDRGHRPPCAAGDALRLPFRDRSFDVVLAPFSLNHFDDPADAARESGRVGSLLLASTYAADDDHPAKAAAEAALTEAGWTRPDWYARLKPAMQAWGTVDAATAVVERAGLRPVRVERVEVSFDELGVDEMLAWRFGLGHIAPFLADLDAPAQARVRERAAELLGPSPEPVVRKVIFVAARPAGRDTISA
jgi:SAM-dependent methyltransferase